MKILMFNPPMSVPESWGTPSINQPLGLMYLTSVLEKNPDMDVCVFDAQAEGWENVKTTEGFILSGSSDDDIIKKIGDIKPSVLCCTIMFSVNAENSYRILEKIKQSFPHCIIIAGGPHVTVKPDEVLSKSFIDFVVIGEGEVTLYELIGEIDRGVINFSHVKGIGWKACDEIIFNQSRDLIKNLDEIPFPALGKFPIEKYIEASKAGRAPRKLYQYSERWTNIFTSRGCPMNCIFCSIHKTMGKVFRPRSPENVIAEMERDYKEFGIRHFNIEDDNMTINRERFIRICNLIKERGLDITWSAPNGIRADTVTEELARAMKESGCRRVFVAPESGCQRVLDEIIDKRMKLEDVERAVSILTKNGIIVDLSFVIGLPGETKEEIMQTFNYARKLRGAGVDKCGFNIATPLYGTRLYDEVVGRGYFDPNTKSCYLSPSEANIETPDFTKQDMIELRNLGEWMVNLSTFEKLSKPFKNPAKIPGYIKTFIKNIKLANKKNLSGK